MNEDSDSYQSIQDTNRLGSSFTQNGFFVGSPKDNFNVSRWLDDSKKLFTNIIKTKPQDINQQQDDFSNIFNGPRRPRTQSVSSDISVDDQPMSERRSSFSERYFSMQMQSKNNPANEKFNTFRTAITSYYD